MTDFGAMRTGSLVVRHHASWRRRSVIVGITLVAALSLYVIYERGRWDGGFSKLAEVQQRRELVSRIKVLEAANEQLRATAANAVMAREVDRKAYGDVEENLSELQSQVLRHREELTFYRGIVSPEDGIGGLRIQRFQVLPAGAENHYRLRLVLVQSMRQDAVVSGSISMEIEGISDNRPVLLLLADVGGVTSANGQITFEFRYFQNLEQDVELPKGFEPRAINVEVRSAKLEPLRESYAWEVHADE